MILYEFRDKNNLIWSFYTKVIKVLVWLGLENSEKEKAERISLTGGSRILFFLFLIYFSN